jgi:type II secretory pathway pseudopilin PulG
MTSSFWWKGEMRYRSERGLSLIEATIVLTAVSILTAAAAPSASRALDRARLARAVDDTSAIKQSIFDWLEDLNGYKGFVADGTDKTSQDVQILVSDGDTPEIGFSGDARWDDPVQSNPALGEVTDFLERHLVTNDPFGDATKAYPLPAAAGNADWRGAYLNAPIDADPWGNRYATNVRYLQAPSDTNNDVIVLSAGPNETIDTAYEQDGTYPGDDDIIALVRRHNNANVP